MVGVALIEGSEPGSIQLGLVEMPIVGVLVPVLASRLEPHDPGLIVHLDDPLCPPWSRSDGVLQLPVVAIQVVVPPAGPLAPPNEVASRARFDVAHALPLQKGVFNRLREQNCGLVGREIVLAELKVAL